MSERRTLPSSKIHADALTELETFHKDVIDEVSRAVESEPVVVVGMSQNPFVKKARAALTEAGIQFKYLEYGSYASQWKRRLAIKLWSGYPTFPQVFVKGTLFGGFGQTKKGLEDGSLKKLLG